MPNLLMWTATPTLLHFDYGVGGFSDDALEHTALEVPLAACYNDVLLPLAKVRGEQLTADEVTRAVVAHAAGTATAPAAIDWLGLALYAQVRFRQAMTKGDPPQDQELCRAAHTLQELLEGIHDRIAEVLNTHLRQTGCCEAV